MILVDNRVGSRELLQAIRALGVNAELAGRLDADFQFEGHSESGPILVGVERKTIQDLADSMREQRLEGEQFPKMLPTYDIHYVVVEGVWRRQRETGLLETHNGGGWKAAKGSYHYAEIDAFLCRLTEIYDVRTWRCGDQEETAAFLVSRYKWWSKPWGEHRPPQSIYAPEPTIKHAPGHRARMCVRRANLLEIWLHALPGIRERAMDLAPFFSSPRDMANADVSRWLTVEGMRIGRKTAQTIVRAVEGTD